MLRRTNIRDSASGQIDPSAVYPSVGPAALSISKSYEAETCRNAAYGLIRTATLLLAVPWTLILIQT